MGGAFLFALNADEQIMMFGNDSTPNVATDADQIDISGTGSQEVNVIIVAG